MSWQTAIAQTYTSAADLIENAVRGIHKLVTDAGWTMLDEISATSGQTDRVYTLPGAAGGKIAYVRIYQVSGTQKIGFGLYSFWDTAGSGTGYNEVKGGFGSSPTEAPHMIQVKSANMIAWLVADGDGLSIAVRYDTPTEYSLTYVGLLPKLFIPTDRSGVTTLSSGVTVAASGTTNLPVVSETNIKVGQKVFVINQTAGANAGNLLRCTVTATAAGQVTVTNDSGTATAFDSGALVGLDPMPSIFLGHVQNQSGATWLGGTISKGGTMLYGLDTLRLTGSAQTLANQAGYGAGFMNMGVYFGAAGPTVAESAQETAMADPYMVGRMGPDLDSKFLVQPVLIVGGFNNSTGNLRTDKCIRGSTIRISYVPKSPSLAAEDVLMDGTARWVVIPRGSTNWYNAWAIQTVQ